MLGPAQMEIKFANLELTSGWESLGRETDKQIILDIKKNISENKLKPSTGRKQDGGWLGRGEG